jgi:hypothetical protein
LETGALPIELLAYTNFGSRIGDRGFCQSPQSAIRNPQSALLGLFMSRVLPAEAAVLAHFQPLCRLLLVLRRAVIAPLTLEAGERDDVSHKWIRSISSSGHLVIWLLSWSIEQSTDQITR